VHDPVAHDERDERIDLAIQHLTRAIVKYPVAAQAAYSALVREGRAFAATDEGRRIRNQLAGSELVSRLRTAWELMTFGMLRDESPVGVLPSVLVEALVQAVFRERFEARLHRAMAQHTERIDERSDDRDPHNP
jgi:hypothetical protein